MDGPIAVGANLVRFSFCEWRLKIVPLDKIPNFVCQVISELFWFPADRFVIKSTKTSPKSRTSREMDRDTQISPILSGDLDWQILRKFQILSNHRFYWRVQFNLGGMVDGDGKFVRVKR